MADNPKEPVETAYKEMGIGQHTWYAATRNLESLGLIAATMGPAGRKVKQFHVTPEGRRVLSRLSEVLSAVANSPAVLAWELGQAAQGPSSARVGEVLCRLIEHAERRADYKELDRLASLATARSHPGEALLARQVSAFLRGRSAEALVLSRQAVKELRRDPGARSLRKALSVQSSCFEYTGAPEKAIAVGIEVRRLAKKAGDPAMEAEAWLGIGVLKGRLDQTGDALKHFEKALAITEKAGLATKRAKVLSNLAFAQALALHPGALATADEALKASRSVGATIAVARTQLVRALLLASRGEAAPAREAMREAERIFGESGHEMGPELVEKWALLVKRILRRRLSRSPVDWRSEALSLARTRPK